jgi:hypothetical protein
MRRPFILLIVILLSVITMSPQPVAAQRPTVVNGGGTATVDGTTVFSQFGMGVVLREDGSAQGHFECLMAGISALPGLHVMSVGGQVHTGSVNGDGSVTFSGVGTVNFGDNGILRDEPFTVTVKPGGAGVGSLQLSCVPCGGKLPVETVHSGRIKIH